ncbi:hypothetical protein [Rhizobium sp. Root1220]|uniref:hypothetical protein n=1 Tax=Rhizobium sp. Root1220 TaxID=1736432 RepID=UPI0012E38139|nr:hypothetical protein [Rhizobium sp. Root1220]
MKDGLTVKLTVDQIKVLIENYLITGAPAGLNSFDEIAAALNDDPAFHTTVDSVLATKLGLAGGTMTGAILNAVFAPSAASTKKVQFDNALITAGQTRNIRVPDADVALSKWELISLSSLNAASQLIQIGLAGFRKLRISGQLTHSSAGTLSMTVSTNNGSSYDTASNYVQQAIVGSNTTVAAGQGTSAAMTLAGGTLDASAPYSFATELEEFNQNSICCGLSRDNGASASTRAIRNSGVFHTGTTARNALRILPGAGTFTGLIMIEGVRA